MSVRSLNARKGLTQACQRLVERTTGSMGSGVLELPEGEVLGAFDSDLPLGFHRTVGQATAALLQSRALENLAESLRSRDENQVPDTYQEIKLIAGGRVHLIKVTDSRRAAVVLVTSPTSNLGLGWAHLRSAAGEIEALLAEDHRPGHQGT